MTGQAGARFEFRVWAERLDDVGRRLRALAEPGAVRETTEVYIVSSATVEANPKIRADLLDIKVLVAVRDGLEQWDVHGKADFPVTAATVRDDLCRLLRVAAPALGRQAYSATQLVDEVVAPHPRLARVEVVKRRRQFALDACTAESADVVVAGRALQTVAVESTDLDAARAARRALGLDDRANTSYPRAIRSTLGGRFAEW